MRREHLYLMVLLALSGSELTADNHELEALFDDATEAVTASKLNLDYTPSVISVLEHDRLTLLGVTTLFEALALLPGVETSVNQLGVKKVIVRGFDNPNNFVFDKAKLLIDGVAVEMGMYGNSSFYYDLPVDVIERIEVLRGPGSALYGTGAFNGAINIVTRHESKSGNTLFAGYGTHDYMKGGAHAGYTFSETARVDVDAYYQRHDRSLRVPNDFMVVPLGGPGDFATLGFDGPYESHERLEDYSVGLTWNMGPWSLRTRLKSDTNGNYFGWDELLEMDDSHRNVQRYFFAELEYSDRIGDGLEWTTKLGYSWYDLELSAQNYFENPLSGNDVTPYEFLLWEKERQSWLGTELVSTAYEGHKLTLGAEAKRMEETESTLYDSVNTMFEALIPGYPIPGTRPLLESGLERSTYSLYLRDSLALGSDLVALVALRGDHYTENDRTYPSAQLGLVYMADEEWHYKLNYGHAFRAPSWTEQYTAEYAEGDGTRAGNPNLDPETTDTIELVAIWHRGDAHHLQGNLYYSVIDGVIDVCDDGSLCTAEYVNLDDRTSYGLEVAYTYVAPNLDQLHLNASLNKTTYENTGLHFEQTMPGVSRLMLKGYYIHYLTPETTLAALVQHYGMRTRNRGGDFGSHPRPDRGLESYTTVDVTFTTPLAEQWRLLATVKNLFDDNVYYASYYGRQSEGIPRDGRSFLLQLQLSF